MKRFWSKVQRAASGCWLWTAHNNGRYGKFRLSRLRRKVYAHRFAYELTHGPIPARLLVRHTCDVTLCVNPDHLVIGTVADNQRDMAERGRGRSGSQKTTMEQRQAIRRRALDGEPQKNLALEFGISRARVCQIVGEK